MQHRQLLLQFSVCLYISRLITYSKLVYQCFDPLIIDTIAVQMAGELWSRCFMIRIISGRTDRSHPSLMIVLPLTAVELRAGHWEGKPSQTPCRSTKGHSVSQSLAPQYIVSP